MSRKGRSAQGGSRSKPENDLERGRALYEKRAWRDAHFHLSRADGLASLGGDDLFRLAICHGLFGNDEGMLSALERAHSAYRESGDLQRAARMAFWLGFRHGSLGETG